MSLPFLQSTDIACDVHIEQCVTATDCILFSGWNLQAEEQKQTMTHAMNSYIDNCAQESCHLHPIMTSDDKGRMGVVFWFLWKTRFATKEVTYTIKKTQKILDTRPAWRKSTFSFQNTSNGRRDGALLLAFPSTVLREIRVFMKAHCHTDDAAQYSSLVHYLATTKHFHVCET